MTPSRWLSVIALLLLAAAPSVARADRPVVAAVRAPWRNVVLNTRLRRQERRVVRAHQSLRSRQIELSAAEADYQTSLREEAVAQVRMTAATGDSNRATNATVTARRAESLANGSLPTQQRAAAAAVVMDRAAVAFSRSVHDHDAAYARVHDQPDGTHARVQRLRVAAPNAAADVRRAESRLEGLQTRALQRRAAQRATSAASASSTTLE